VYKEKAMKVSNRLMGIAILSGLLPCLTSASAEAGQEKGETTTSRGGKASTYMKGAANTNAQWSADPEKGWVRAEERHKLQNERQSTDKSKKNAGKHKDQSTKGSAGRGVMN
jgi:hypothetical protein